MSREYSPETRMLQAAIGGARGCRKALQDTSRLSPERRRALEARLFLYRAMARQLRGAA